MGDILTQPALIDLLARYGVAAIGLLVALESFGLPLPGETALVGAALYAAATGTPDINAVVGAAVIGAILGDNAGYLLGRRFGLPWLLRFGPRIGLTEPRIKIGRYLFARYGAPVVFAGRFIALLRALAAFLAGANDMAWPRFVAANAAGAVLWASLFGYGAFWFGQAIAAMSHDLATIGLGLGALALIAAAFAMRRFAAHLQAKAEAAYPGTLDPGPRAQNTT